VAETLDEYVEIAARLARDTDRLVQERTTLRDRLLASPIRDAQKYARAVEAAYRMLWRRWCSARSAT
jgi:protein O-GlcNAc transferase